MFRSEKCKNVVPPRTGVARAKHQYSWFGARETVSIVVCFARRNMDDLVLLKMPQDLAKNCRSPNHRYMLSDFTTKLAISFGYSSNRKVEH